MNRRILKVLVAVVVIAGFFGCSATPTRRSFKEGWKDSYVSTKVKVKLTTDKLVEKRNFDVDTWRGVVTLTGRVRSENEKERAEQLAWQIKGVRGVDNYLKVVDDASYEWNEAVARAPEEKVVAKAPVATKAKAKKPVAKPVKVQETLETVETEEVVVNSKVSGPVVFEDDGQNQSKVSAARSRFLQPSSSAVKEQDLTDEDRLAREAADELKKLRGEDVTE